MSMNAKFNLLKRTKLIFGAMFVAIALLVPASAFAQSLKVAYVDLQEALNKVDEGKKAKNRLKKDFDKKQKQLDAAQNELMKMQKEFEEGAMMLSEDAKRKKAVEFQQKMVTLQQTYVKLQGELAQAEAKETKKIFDKMGKIIEEIAKEKGYDLVLERTESAILFAKDDMNLTDELIKRYNAKH